MTASQGPQDELKHNRLASQAAGGGMASPLGVQSDGSVRFPRLLLISETTLATTRVGVSANPTLYNLFAGYPPDQILSMAPSHAIRPNPPFDRQYLDFPSTFLPRPPRGRRFVEPILSVVDCQILDILPIPHLRQIRAFDPELVLVSPITPAGLIVGRRMARTLGRPTVTFFMDDWPAVSCDRWLTSSISMHARNILRESNAWIMISDELREIMIKRYHIPGKTTLIAHNPVEISGKEPPTFMPRRAGRFRVVYAGSVHSMHLDGLLAVAEAIHILRSTGLDIELILHTTSWFERYHEAHWSRWGVTMGGLIPYNKFCDVLRDADLLLLTLSFEEKYSHMAMFSLLTKITDYMATGVPLIVCGPVGSASVNFVNRWGCGLVCATNIIGHIADFLREQMDRPQRNVEMAALAYEVLRSEFSSRPVQRRLYEFLTRVTMP